MTAAPSPPADPAPPARGGVLLRLGAHAGIYLASSVAAKLVPFLMLPVLTRLLAPAEYGAMSVFVGLNALVAACVGMSMHANVTSNFYRESRAHMATLLGNVVLLLLATGALALGVAVLVAAETDALFSLPSAWLLAMPPLAVMAMIVNLATTVLRNEGRPFAYAAFELGQMALTVGVTITLLLGTALGWRAQAIGLFAGETTFCLVALAYLRRRGWLLLRPDRAQSRAILALSLPLLPHALGGIVIAVGDRLFIERMVGLEAVALYSIGYSFGMAMSLFTDATMKAWTPWLYRQLVHVEIAAVRRAIVRACWSLVALFLLGASLVALAAQWLLDLLVADAYRGAAAFVAWVTLAYAIRGVYQVFFPFLVHLRRTAFLAFSTTVAAGLNLLLNYVLILRFGAIGGAYATVLAFAASALLVFWYQRRMLPMPWFGGAG